MGSNPINLALRFLLEIAALLAMGIWGWRQSENWTSYLLAFGMPLIAAFIWGVFAVPDDPSRSGSAPIAVPGILRLVIELCIFSFAAWALYDLGYITICWIMGGIVIIHYVISYDRILWLIKR